MAFLEDNKPVDEIPLTLEDITAGTKFERTVVLKSVNDAYNGKAVKVRSLTGRVFRELMHKFHIKDNDPTVSFDMSMEACRRGIVDKAIASRVDDLDEEVISQLGMAIIVASQPKDEKKVEELFQE